MTTFLDMFKDVKEQKSLNEQEALNEHDIPKSFKDEKEALVIVDDVTYILTSPALKEFMESKNLSKELEEITEEWYEIVGRVKSEED